MHALALSLLLVAADPVPAECRNPPPRASSYFWPFLEACGCESVEAPPRASSDFDRFQATCAEWRRRNPKTTVVVVGGSPSPSPLPSPSASPLPVGCRDVPPRASSTWWTHLERCGCAGTEPPTMGASDYERYLKTCGTWRERNPQPTTVIVIASPSPSPR
jgi:hypothetical protein